MSNILIYTSNLCPYCTMAKRLLTNKAAKYTELNVDATPGLRAKMIERTKRRTVPQIYIGDRHIGGFDDLYRLEKEKLLDPMLALA